jgi:hypothetical protein
MPAPYDTDVSGVGWIAVRALMIDRHPDWTGQEWIGPGVGCLYSEHAA